MLSFLFNRGKRKITFEDNQGKSQALTQDNEMETFPFEPTNAEFEQAKRELAHKPDGSKLSKKTSKFKYSFIKVDGKIYAMSNKHCYTIKHGGFSIFKIGMTDKKKLIGIKIEPRKLRNLDDPGLIAAKRMGLFIAQAQRNDSNMVFPLPGEVIGSYNKSPVENKLYSIVRLGGNDLTKIKLPLTETQRQLLSLRLCDLTNHMHKLNIIHGDINPGNILVNIDGNHIEVELIDFDFSKIVIPPQTSMTEPGIAFGMPPYTAPETKQSKIYSFSSDIYALGMVLFFDLNLSIQRYKNAFINSLNENWTLPTYFLFLQDRDAFNAYPDKEIIKDMTHLSPEHRISISEATKRFCEKLLANSEVQQDPKLLSEVKAIQARAFGQSKEIFNPKVQNEVVEPELPPYQEVKGLRKKRVYK